MTAKARRPGSSDTRAASAPWPVALCLGAALALACAAPPPGGLGIENGRLSECPSSPNCVFSESRDESHRTRPFVLRIPATQAWPLVREAVESLQGAEIVAFTDDYLHAEMTTPLMRYVDDLELQLMAERGRVAVRSASRRGWWDMGANRERVWELRRALATRGVVP